MIFALSDKVEGFGVVDQNYRWVVNLTDKSIYF